jgi:glycosyltransferase involved in cell wall biosynthesis
MDKVTEDEIIASWINGIEEPVVSVICISYNHEDYIEEALDSILHQKTSFPFEIVVHDDASTDATARIIRQYESEYPRIIKAKLRTKNIFSEVGGGFINDLLSEAKGEFIAICEGDDAWIDRTKLEKQVFTLRKNDKLSISIHNAIVEDCRSGDRHIFNKSDLPEILSLKDIFFRGWFSPTASFFFRNSGWNGDIRKDVNGDMVILFENALNGAIHYSPEPMSLYRYFSSSSLSSAADRAFLYKKKVGFYMYAFKKVRAPFKIILGGLMLVLLAKKTLISRK